MAKTFVNIQRSEMTAFLEGQGFQSMTLPSTVELVWGRVFRCGEVAISMRVYTGINPSGESRDCGKDAIRLMLFYRTKDGAVREVGGSKRVNRVEGWQDRLQERIDAWKEQIGPLCPVCNAPMKLRKPGKNCNWKAFYGCVEWKKEGGCNGTRDAKGQDTTKSVV